MKTQYAITTTQDSFHVMRGHIADGTIIVLPSGEMLEINASMKGWRLTNERGEIVGESNNAFTVQDMVLSYGK